MIYGSVIYTTYYQACHIGGGGHCKMNGRELDIVQELIGFILTINSLVYSVERLLSPLFLYYF